MTNLYLSDPLPIPPSRAARLTRARARLAFGLTWRTYAASDSKAERLRFARAHAATHFSVRQIAAQRKEVQVGFARFERKQTRKTELYAGAAWLAAYPEIAHEQAALILIEADDVALAVLLIRGVIRVDERVPLEQVDARRVELQTMAEQAGLSPVTFVNGERLIDRAHADDRLLDIDAMVASVGRHRPVGRIDEMPWQIPGAVKGLAVLVVAGFGLYQAYGWINPPPPPAELPPTAEQLYQRAVDAIFQRPAPLASSQIPALLTAFEHVPVVRAGWKFKHAECTFSRDAATPACRITWARTGGTFDEFQRVSTEADLPLAFAANGETLTSAAPAVPAGAPVLRAQMASWPSWPALVEQLQSPAQALSTRPDALESHDYHVTLGDPQRLTVQPVHLRRLLMSGKWSVTGQSWQLPLVAALPSNLTVEKVELDLSADGLKFNAKGTYYVNS
ncbi:type 4b pilus protein PilO2 [Burkholderia cepacia]|uniref:type 4b pilus protein PilO2 n=1 Tax=Burkholderia cepacia TaxID=292 RepID=UPI002ABDC6F5|nr:type 4b pilus protein PilO2 [Burkholderia cepacia]